MQTAYLRVQGWQDKDDYKIYTFTHQGIWVHYDDETQLAQIKKNVSKAISKAIRDFDTSDYIHKAKHKEDETQ